MLQQVNIFMDDIRNCPMHPSWLLARSAEGALELMRAFGGRVHILSLDHDLGDKSVPEKHGKWFVNRMVEEGLYADIIYLHTSNGEGRKNMFSYLYQAREFGVLPRGVKIHNGPHPGFNLESGALYID